MWAFLVSCNSCTFLYIEIFISITSLLPYPSLKALGIGTVFIHFLLHFYIPPCYYLHIYVLPMPLLPSCHGFWICFGILCSPILNLCPSHFSCSLSSFSALILWLYTPPFCMCFTSLHVPSLKHSPPCNKIASITD